MPIPLNTRAGVAQGADGAGRAVLLVVAVAGAPRRGSCGASITPLNPFALADCRCTSTHARLTAGETLSAASTCPISKPDRSSTRSSARCLAGAASAAFRWPRLGLDEPGRLGVAEGELDGGVAVTLGRLELTTSTGPGPGSPSTGTNRLSASQTCVHAELFAREMPLLAMTWVLRAMWALYAAANREWLTRPRWPAERLRFVLHRFYDGGAAAQTSVGERFPVEHRRRVPPRATTADSQEIVAVTSDSRRSRPCNRVRPVDLISMSTPAGRSRRWSDSTVLRCRLQRCR